MIGVSVGRMHGTCNKYAGNVVAGDLEAEGSDSQWFDKRGKQIGGSVLN